MQAKYCFCLNIHTKIINNLQIYVWYIKTNDRKLGLNYVRKCKQTKQKLIKDQFSQIEHLFTENPQSSINWINIYKNGQFCFPAGENSQQLLKWVQELLLEVQNQVVYFVTSFGFVRNPKGSKEIQSYHYDYDLQHKSLFIPMTYLVTDNSTQFLQHPISCQPFPKTQRYAFSDKQLLEREGSDFFVVSQVVSKPYVILKLEAGTVHRGIKNTTDEDRYMFYIGYSPKELKIQESLIHKQKITLAKENKV